MPFLYIVLMHLEQERSEDMQENRQIVSRAKQVY